MIIASLYSLPVKSLKEGYKYTFSLNKAGFVQSKLMRPEQVSERLNKPKEETRKRAYGESRFGPVKGAFYYVDRPRSLKRLGFEPGVVIYRDGFRVEPYGSSEDDWLGVKSKKASRQGHAPISPSRLFGFIEISRHNNPHLKDLTNREGLLETEDFEEFHTL